MQNSMRKALSLDLASSWVRADPPCFAAAMIDTMEEEHDQVEFVWSLCFLLFSFGFGGKDLGIEMT